MTIALGIPHTPWLEDRAKSFDRLMSALGDHPHVCTRVFTERMPNWAWSQDLWRWGLESLADHLLQLQDDVIVDRDFWPNLWAMLEAVPDQIIGLESVHNASHFIYDQGGSWYSTSDGLIGVGYVIPRPVLAEFLTWRETQLRPNAFKSVSEDTLIDIFCLATGRKVYHPVPTIIDHDVTLGSTYGNDKHTHRRPVLSTVRGTKPHGYKADQVPHLGRFYVMTPQLCRRWVKDFSLKDLERART